MDYTRLSQHLAKRRTAIALIVMLGVLLYCHTLHVPFVFDGIREIKDNETLRYLKPFLSFDIMLARRQPVRFTFALNHWLGGTDITGYHLVNISIHLLSGIIVYFLVLSLYQVLPLPFAEICSSRKKKKRRGKKVDSPVNDSAKRADGSRGGMGAILALFSALLFVAHPLQTQAVTYIVQRYASMAALFYLSSALFYLRARISQHTRAAVGAHDSNTHQNQASVYQIALLYLAAVVSGVLAVLCKENTASLPGIIILIEVLCFRPFFKPRKKFLWISLMSVLWVIFILFVFGFFDQAGSNESLLEDVSDLMRETKKVGTWQYLCTQFNVVTRYIRLLFMPVGQNLDYKYPFKKGFLDGLTPLAFLFLTAVAAAGVMLRKKHPAVTFGIAWFFIALSVESSIIPISDAMFEHRVYLPLFGFALIIPYVVSIWFRKISTFFIICFCLVLAFGTATFARNSIWRDDTVLWQDVISKAPHNDRAHYNLGLAYSSRERIDDAINFYRKAIEINPRFTQAYYNCGNAFFDTGRLEEAIPFYRKAIESNPKYTEAYYNFGNTYYKLDNRKEAIPLYKKTIDLKPEHGSAHKNIAISYYHEGQFDLAIIHADRALELEVDPGDEFMNAIEPYRGR